MRKDKEELFKKIGSILNRVVKVPGNPVQHWLVQEGNALVESPQFCLCGWRGGQSLARLLVLLPG